MASTFFGLTIAYSGLQASQASINVTAHNLSNVDTDGYTKETAVKEAASSLRTYAPYGTLGAGVDVTEISQTRDSYYDEKYRNNQTYYGEYEAKNNYMSQIESFFNEFILDGYTEEYNNFFKNVSQTMLNPEDNSTKNSLIQSAVSMTDYFNYLASNLKEIQEDANNEVKDAVEQINSLAQSIYQLNKQINQIEACYGNANDLRDSRNALVDELAKIVNITTNEEDLGNNLTNYTININGSTLVNSYGYHELVVNSRADTDARNNSDVAGLYDISWDTGQEFNIYSSSLGGQLKGLIDIRDGCNGQIESVVVDDNGDYVYSTDGYFTTEFSDYDGKNTDFKGIPYYQAQLNKFMTVFADAVNEILKTGYSSDGETKGASLFVIKDNQVAFSASNVTVNKDLQLDPSKLATKSRLNTGAANADIIEKLNTLQTAQIYNGGTGSYFLESIISDESIDTNKAKNFLQNYTNLKTTIQNQRLSVMGVDYDEEAMDLVTFQQSYNLSSKMMSVLNEIYDKLINQTGT